MSLTVGDTFLGGLPGQKEHLWALLTRPDKRGEVVVVNFSTAIRGWDNSCVVAPGEHPFVTRQCYARYGDSKKIPLEAITKGLVSGIISQHKSVSSELLQRLRKGALVSEDTTPEIIRAIEDDIQNLAQ
jgi:hypothetical protein